MPAFPIRRGSRSADVAPLQEALNRLGALLDDDGDFGGATERAVHQAQRQFGLAQTGEVDEALWNRLKNLPEPSPLLPTRGITFLAREEIGSRERYDQIYCHPCWPGGESGITIGIGFDLRFTDAAGFTTDWQARVSPAVALALAPWIGKQGSAAAAAGLQNVVVPFSAAWWVYLDRTIPNFVERTKGAFPGYDALPPLCKSALVSLVYNRGPSLEGDRRVEMRAIRDLVQAGRFAAVPAQFIAMQHLWPDVRGLRDRREREAKLWSAGLG